MSWIQAHVMSQSLFVLACSGSQTSSTPHAIHAGRGVKPLNPSGYGRDRVCFSSTVRK
jgi:hypothetical protein